MVWQRPAWESNWHAFPQYASYTLAPIFKQNHILAKPSSFLTSYSFSFATSPSTLLLFHRLPCADWCRSVLMMAKCLSFLPHSICEQVGKHRCTQDDFLEKHDCTLPAMSRAEGRGAGRKLQAIRAIVGACFCSLLHISMHLYIHLYIYIYIYRLYIYIYISLSPSPSLALLSPLLFCIFLLLSLFSLLSVFVSFRLSRFSFSLFAFLLLIRFLFPSASLPLSLLLSAHASFAVSFSPSLSSFSRAFSFFVFFSLPPCAEGSPSVVEVKSVQSHEVLEVYGGLREGSENCKRKTQRLYVRESGNGHGNAPRCKTSCRALRLRWFALSSEAAHRAKFSASFYSPVRKRVFEAVSRAVHLEDHAQGTCSACILRGSYNSSF